MNLPGGIRVRLALGLLGVVGGALLVAYLIVVPSLEKRLVDAKLSGLRASAVPLAENNFPRSNRYVWDAQASLASVATNARVVVYSVLTATPVSLLVGADSQGVESSAIAGDPVALGAVAARAPDGGSAGVDRGRVERAGREYAEVAIARRDGVVILFSAPLADSLTTVHVIERRLAYASLAALALALVLGSLAAAVHARRIRRLESAAERIALGAFDEPIRDDGDDELGELARAFERMRVQLARLDTARRAFVATASHELRTPLFALGGFLELFADEDVDEETRQGFLTTMREQVRRMTKLAEDLLDLSRVDAGGMQVETVEVELGELARGLVEELHPLSDARGGRLTVDGAGPVWAWGDEQRILQIGRALVGNAIVHTPPGTNVVLQIGRGVAHAWLAVEDDGPGIPADQLGRVFDRFFRVEGGIAPGSGLGLAIARELAELMGGRIHASSRPGRSVFTLELPLAAGADGTANGQAGAATASPFSRGTASTMRP